MYNTYIYILLYMYIHIRNHLLHMKQMVMENLSSALTEELCSLMEAGGRRIEEYDAYASLCQRWDVFRGRHRVVDR